MLDRDQQQILIIGPAHWRFGEGWSPAQPALVVHCPPNTRGHHVDDNTVLLAWDALVNAPTWLTTADGTTLVAATGTLFHRLEPTPMLARLSRTMWSGQAPAPLFLFGRSGPTITVHVVVRLGEYDGLFVRAHRFPVPTGPLPAAGLMRAAIDSAGRHREFLNNHQCCYQKFWPDIEWEHKITLLRQSDLHAVTVGLRNLVGSSDLPGTIWDYRDDYQIWDFDNHLFEITGPASEAGYLSFIPDAAGTVIVKRKWFTSDRVNRRETRWRGVKIPREMDGYTNFAAAHVTGTTRFLGSFRRTRFDSTCEFTRTGNVYGIVVDWCRPLNRSDVPHLYQIELEYMHSRTLDRAARFAVHDELETLVNATRAYLERMGAPYSYPGESKLTYLRSLAEGKHHER